MLAGLAGVSPSWISQVERGTRAPDSLRCLIPVAKVLGVEPMDLIEVPRRREHAGSGGMSGLDELVTVLRRDPQRLTQKEPDVEGVAKRLDAAEALRRQGRYTELGPVLASIIADAESAARMAAGTEREPTAFTSLCHAYQTAVYMLLSAGENHGVVWVAAERSSVAAHRTGDPVIQGLSARCRALGGAERPSASRGRPVVGTLPHLAAGRFPPRRCRCHRAGGRERGAPSRYGAGHLIPHIPQGWAGLESHPRRARV